MNEYDFLMCFRVTAGSADDAAKFIEWALNHYSTLGHCSGIDDFRLLEPMGDTISPLVACEEGKKALYATAEAGQLPCQKHGLLACVECALQPLPVVSDERRNLSCEEGK